MSAHPSTDSLSGVLSFLLEIDQLKTIHRRSYVAGGLRRENSAEHSWHVAIAAWMLCRQAGVQVDTEHLLKLALAHDLGEIDAGDVSVYSARRGEQAPAERATLERLTRLAPTTLSELLGLWAEYEAQTTAESQWLKVADRIMPFLHNLASKGKTWREQAVVRRQVIDINQPIARTHPALFAWIESQCDHAIAEGWLRPDAAADGGGYSAHDPLDFGEIVLEGREVILRPLTREDADALALAASEDRQSYQLTPVPNGVAQARAYIEKALTMRNRQQRYAFAVVWNGRVVGSTSLWDFEVFDWPVGSPNARASGVDVVEIGHTWLAASAQRSRCNTEAKYLLLRHAFEHWTAHRVRIRTDERNQRSRAAIERLGAKLEGIIRADKPGADGSVRNSAYYSITQAEWPEVRAHLERKLA
ncbi:MAG: GNAT family N-acetyltransferase [Polyangiales bacterium]